MKLLVLEIKDIILPEKQFTITSFSKVFVADGMCSLSKVFFDWGILIILAYHYPSSPPRVLISIFVPSLLASFPYLIRARQCIVNFLVLRNVPSHKTKDSTYLHIVNAFKYLSSLVPIVLSAIQQLSPVETRKDLDKYLVFFLLLNSSYCFAWDILVDWGMGQDFNVSSWNEVAYGFIPCNAGIDNKKDEEVVGRNSIDNDESQNDEDVARLLNGESSSSSLAPLPVEPPSPKIHHESIKKCSFLRQNLGFGPTLTWLAIILNLLLRSSWMLRYKQKTWFSDADQYVLVVQFLEVGRRAIWNLLRVEWEIVNTQREKVRSISSVSDE